MAFDDDFLDDDIDLFKEKKVPKNYQKVGLDTSILAHLVHYKVDLSKFRKSYLPDKCIIYFAWKTKNEFIGVMMRKYGFDERGAREAWEALENFFNLKRIFWDKDIERQHAPHVKLINEKLAKVRDSPKYSQTFKIGEGDIEIISNFMKEKVDLIYTSDRAFHETCKDLGLHSRLIYLHEFLKEQTK
jgi:predicted nucleic acid-binding protein